MDRIIKCPQCKKATTFATSNEFRPFCSQRCQLLDLGDWAAGKYAVAAEDAADVDQTKPESDDDSEDPDGTLRQ